MTGIKSGKQLRIIAGMLFKNWTSLLLFEIVYRSIGFTVVFPLARRLLGYLPALSGSSYLSQENLPSAFQNPLSFLLLALVAVLAGLYIYLEPAALILCCEAGYQGKPLSFKRLWTGGASGVLRLLRPSSLASLLLLPVLMLSFFSVTSVYLMNMRIPEFILDFIGESPTRRAVFLCVLLLIHLFLYYCFFGLPFLFLEGFSLRRSFQESRRLLKGRGLSPLASLLSHFAFFGAVCAFFTFLGTAALAALCRISYGPVFGRREFRLRLAFYYVSWSLIVNTFLSMLFCAVIVMLYHEYRNDARPAAQTGERKKRPYLRIAAGTAVLAFLLLFSETEIGAGALFQSAPPYETALIAHRAGAAAAPENTLSALSLAVSEGASMAEIDVQQLRDGTLVVLHDDSFRRTAGMDLKVWDADYETVKKLDAGSYFSDRFAGEPVPTLEQMLSYAKDRIFLMIELKSTGHERGLEKEVLRQIRECGMQKQCVIASMNLDILKRVKELEPDMPTVYISVFLISSRYDLKYLDAYSLETSSLSPGLVTESHLQGKKVYAWTANTGESVRKILRCQADGIITDNPGLALSFLEKPARFLLFDSLTELFFPDGETSLTSGPS